MNKSLQQKGLGLMLSALVSTSLYSLPISKAVIMQPHVGQTMTDSTPLIIGCAKDVFGIPLRHLPVIVIVDGLSCGQVVTDQHGVFRYQLRNQLALANGNHEVHAVVKPTQMYIPGGQFTVNASKTKSTKKSKITRQGNASLEYSYVAYPYEGADLNTPQVTIVVIVADDTDTAVVGEHVQIYIGDTEVAALITDENGLAVYQLAADQALIPDGDYSVNAYLADSEITLVTNNFTIDTQIPNAPVITSPTEDEVMDSSTVIVTGTTTAADGSQITSFMDDPDQDYGEVGYSSDNAWSIEWDGLADGDHTTNAYVIDDAENQSPLSDDTDFSVSA